MTFRVLPAILICLAGSSFFNQRPPSVNDVMRRVAAYVDAYGERASIVVATERYTQRSRRLLDESARFNIGPITRDFNVANTQPKRSNS